MALIETRAASVRFPFAVVDNTNGSGVQRVACTGAAQTFALEQKMKGCFVYFRAIGVEVQCAAATSAQALVLDQASSAAANTSSAAAGMTLYAGEFFDRVLLDGQTHLCWISRTATGFVEFCVSEG
jgi:hypothetical protein